jgi:hypothetical protein
MSAYHTFARVFKARAARAVGAVLVILFISIALPAWASDALDAQRIAEASGTKTTTAADGVVRIGWSRADVAVAVDGMTLPPAAGLGSWAAFAPMARGAMVMGDTVVFEDEIDAAMDAAFADGLSVTALHNHFAYDTPKVYFMHIGGEGKPDDLARAVKGVWDAIRAVRAAHATPATGFGGSKPTVGHVSSDAVAKIVGSPATDTQGVAKITIGRPVSMSGMTVGESMGVTTWIAFSGEDALAAADGDIVMSANEIQPVLKALRKAHFHVVALHNHMIDTAPMLYFTHFWATGTSSDLARGFRAVLDAQKAANH